MVLQPYYNFCNFRDRMYELERKEMELELEDRRRVEIKKNLINDAARKQDEPVDDSKLVEAMFDFLPDSSSEAPTPGKIEICWVEGGDGFNEIFFF